MQDRAGHLMPGNLFFSSTIPASIQQTGSLRINLTPGRSPKFSPYSIVPAATAAAAAAAAAAPVAAATLRSFELASGADVVDTDPVVAAAFLGFGPGTPRDVVFPVVVLDPSERESSSVPPGTVVGGRCCRGGAIVLVCFARRTARTDDSILFGAVLYIYYVSH